MVSKFRRLTGYYFPDSQSYQRNSNKLNIGMIENSTLGSPNPVAQSLSIQIESILTIHDGEELWIDEIPAVWEVVGTLQRSLAPNKRRDQVAAVPTSEDDA